jgi:hypothetical protein
MSEEDVAPVALAGLREKLRRGTAEAEQGNVLDGDVVFDELRELIELRSKPDREGI